MENLPRRRMSPLSRARWSTPKARHSRREPRDSGHDHRAGRLMARVSGVLTGIFGTMLEKRLRRATRPHRDPRRAVAVRPAADHRPVARTAAERHAAELRARGVKKVNAASAAVDRRTGRVYTGHSREGIAVPPQVRSRLPDPSKDKWPSDNCGEVNAAAKAVSDGADVDDLVIQTVRVKDGKYFEPCLNCRTWVNEGSAP